MYLKTQNLIIRDLKTKDAERIYQFVREPSTYRYMPNNADDYETLQDYLDAPYWFREPEQEDSINFRVGRYYAVAIPASDEIIGVVGRIATISCDNLPSNKLIKKCNFKIMEKRIPIRHGRLMEDDRYFYYRKYRA